MAYYYSTVLTVNSVRSEVKNGDISPGVEGTS
jgi:hypothetical protein